MTITTSAPTMLLTRSFKYLFVSDPAYQGGVNRIQVFLLRLLFGLMFVFLSYDAWHYILNHTGPWDPIKAAAWCMWGAYAIISFIGVMRPLKMLPIVLFEIVYKVAWLLVVAYPLWQKNQLAGSSAEGMANIFIWVIFPIVAMPWPYLFKTYILGQNK